MGVLERNFVVFQTQKPFPRIFKVLDHIIRVYRLPPALGRIDTENLFGLRVNATSPIVFRVVSLGFTFVGFIALRSIQTRLLPV